jgi:hypothetical protein
VDGSRRQGGFVTIEYVLAVGISMVVLVVMANFIVDQYGLGVVRAAIDQGVRAGSRAAAPVAACEQAAKQALDDLLGGRAGSMGAGVSLSCREAGGRLDARADGRFRAWLRPLPDLPFSATATAVLERAP